MSDTSLCERAWTLTQSGQYDEAISLYHQCIADGNLTDALISRTHRNIGLTQQRQGNFLGSIESFNLALSFVSEDPWSDLVNRANSHSHLGHFEDALKDYDTAAKTSPATGDIEYNRGIVFEKMNNAKSAYSEFRKAYDRGLRSTLIFERLMAYGDVEKDMFLAIMIANLMYEALVPEYGDEVARSVSNSCCSFAEEAFKQFNFSEMINATDDEYMEVLKNLVEPIKNESVRAIYIDVFWHTVNYVKTNVGFQNLTVNK
jgi:tetratricopeptide (TPR) repeat protein